MSVTRPGPGPGPDYTGRCHISQGDMYLTEDNGRAITTHLNIGGRFVWNITYADPSANLIDPIYTFTLLPSGSVQPPPIPVADPVLTLGYKVMHEVGIEMFVEPPKQPSDKHQVWALADVNNNLFPKQLTAHILSTEFTDLTAATAIILTAEMPIPYKNVNAVPMNSTEEDKTWLITYLRDQ